MEFGDSTKLSPPPSLETSAPRGAAPDPFEAGEIPVSEDWPIAIVEEAGREDPWAEFGDPPAAAPDRIDSESRARHWAALLTGNAGTRNGSIEFAQAQLIDWLMQLETGVPKDLTGLPDAFQTTRFWGEIKTIESPIRFLKTVSDSLRSGTLSFFEAVDHIGRHFGWDEERILKWKQGLENRAGLTRWLPAYNHAQEYLSAAFPLGRAHVDRLRESLLQSIDEPHGFLDPGIRNEFDRRFLEFKKGYMDLYFLLHEDALHVTAALKKDEIKIDPAALRNLDLLSGLQHTDKSYLNRVKLLAKWIRNNQCSMPLNQILELYPRCYCNFNPRSHQQPVDSAAQINGIIREGLEYFRSILRGCAHLITPELKTLPIDDGSLKQLMAVLSDGPMIPLSAQSIKILNRIIAKHSSEFLSEIRRTGRKRPAPR